MRKYLGWPQSNTKTPFYILQTVLQPQEASSPHFWPLSSWYSLVRLDCWNPFIFALWALLPRFGCGIWDVYAESAKVYHLVW